MTRTQSLDWWLRLAAEMSLGLMLLATTACSRDHSWGLYNISGLKPDLELRLTDQHGREVHGTDFRGKVALLYFGYMHCPDVCPMTLGNLSQAVSRLGAEADSVRVLFVTVDPARDTLEELRSYVAAFGPQFVGLRGSDPELKSLAKRYRVSYGLGKPDASGNYEVSHSSGVFVFDPQGQARLLAHRSEPPDVVARDLARLIEGG